MGLDSLKQQIKKEIHEFTISPFNRHIALEKLEENVLGLLADCVCIPRKQDGELLEKLAELEHEQWNHWMNYQEKKFRHITDITVDEWYKQQELWQRWIRLSQTPYDKLTEKEKESDREWARKVLKLLELGDEK